MYIVWTEAFPRKFLVLVQFQVNFRSSRGQHKVYYRSISGLVEVNNRFITGQFHVNYRGVGNIDLHMYICTRGGL